MSVGAIEIVMAAVLAVLAAAAVVTAVVLVAAASLSATTLATAPLAEGMRRRHRREWHPPTTWIPSDLDQIRASTPPTAPVRVLSLVSSRRAGATVDLLAAQVAPNAANVIVDHTPLTVARACLQPAATLDLPAHSRGSLLLYVVAGRGTLGAQRRSLRAGQLTTVAPGRRLSIMADADPGAPALEVLVFDGPPVASVPQVLDRVDETPRRHAVRRRRIRRKAVRTPVGAVTTTA